MKRAKRILYALAFAFVLSGVAVLVTENYYENKMADMNERMNAQLSEMRSDLEESEDKNLKLSEEKSDMITQNEEQLDAIFTEYEKQKFYYDKELHDLQEAYDELSEKYDKLYKPHEEIPLSEELQYWADFYSKEYDLPVGLIYGVIESESNFDIYNNIYSCHGLMAVHDCTFDWLNEEIGITDLTDPVQNMHAGCFILRYFYDIYGDWNKTLVCYNCGEGGAMDSYFSRGVYTSAYSRLVLERMEKWGDVLNG